MSIATKLEALLSAANEKTEQANTNLTDAIADLIDGYHSGGGDETVKMGNLAVGTPEVSSGQIPITTTQGLGFTPKYILLVRKTQETGTYTVHVSAALNIAVWFRIRVTNGTTPSASALIKGITLEEQGHISMDSDGNIFAVAGNYGKFSGNYIWIAAADT